MQVPVEVLECSVALYLISGTNRWRSDYFFPLFSIPSLVVSVQWLTHISQQTPSVNTITPNRFSPQLLTYRFAMDPHPDAQGAPFGIRQGCTCNPKPSVLFQMTWTDDVLQYTFRSEKVSRGVEVKVEWKVTPDFYPGDRSLCPTKHHQSFPKPRNMAWTWNLIWAALCISIRAGGNELWRITHRRWTVCFSVCIWVVVPALQRRSDAWKIIKGNFQSKLLDIPKFTERWELIGDKDSMHSIISSLYFYCFSCQEGGGLKSSQCLNVFSLQITTIFSHRLSDGHIETLPFLPWCN